MEELKDNVYKLTLKANGVKNEDITNALNDGDFICPVCLERYKPKHPSKQEAFQTQDMESREQWLSHTCSNKCWDKMFKGG
jgi:hypothetical protein